MRKIKFAKMVAAGNDFVLIEGDRVPAAVRRAAFVARLCDRRYGVGADGLLLLGRSRKAEVRMRIFNADGSEAEMCGNGARCCALYISHQSSVFRRQRNITIETKAGVLEAQVSGDDVKIKLTDPLDLKLGMTVNVAGRDYEVDYINTGVPHAVIETKDLEDVPVKEAGRQIRHHEIFRPAGTNVNFFKTEKDGRIRVRTYERGVEDETLACGTGSVASAIVSVLNHGAAKKFGGEDTGTVHKVFVGTQSGETLTVYFRVAKRITDVWLEGKARKVFEGEYAISNDR